ncbi:MAG: nucleotidyltransferase family protein [Chitinophagales bacterium]
MAILSVNWSRKNTLQNEQGQSPIDNMKRIQQAIILAGGLGTRLRASVPELPKSLAPVAGKPFISYLINHFSKEGIYDFIFALGYKKELIIEYLETLPKTLHWSLSEERNPLGTGGAIRKACNLSLNENIFVANGDSFFGIELGDLAALHVDKSADCTIALKPMEHFDRYGAVELDPDSRVTSFKEKKFYPSGFINGGIYALRVDSILNQDFPESFSFENDFLGRECIKGKIFGQVQDRYFIDIGIPADFEKAQSELPKYTNEEHA